MKKIFSNNKAYYLDGIIGYLFYTTMDIYNNFGAKLKAVSVGLNASCLYN